MFFKPCHSKFMIFRAKIGILVKYLYVFHTLFILYLEGNHTLFGEKIYFIWKFSSGNTAFPAFDLAPIPESGRRFVHRILWANKAAVGERIA